MFRDDDRPSDPRVPPRRARVRLEELEDRTNPVGFGSVTTLGDPGILADDTAKAVATDAAGNTYVAGRFAAVVDFDPGVGVVSLDAANGATFVAKYTPAGGLAWAKQLGGDVANSIAVDAAGNVYTVGTVFGGGDFDPGPGVYTLTTNGYWDAFVSKLDSAGNFVWAKTLGGPAEDFGSAVTLDAAGNVFAAGTFRGTADFDPAPNQPGGAGVYSLTSAGNDDGFVTKLDPAGNFVWATRVGGTSPDGFSALATDAAGDVIATGSFQAKATIGDGGPTFTAAYQDGLVAKWDAAGSLIWAKAFGQNSSTIGVGGTGVAVDAAGAIYTTGGFYGGPDFDPGPGTFILSSVGYGNPYVSKLDAAGNFVWAEALTGASFSHSYGNALALDPAGERVHRRLLRGDAGRRPRPRHDDPHQRRQLRHLRDEV